MTIIPAEERMPITLGIPIDRRPTINQDEEAWAQRAHQAKEVFFVYVPSSATSLDLEPKAAILSYYQRRQRLIRMTIKTKL